MQLVQELNHRSKESGGHTNPGADEFHTTEPFLLHLSIQTESLQELGDAGFDQLPIGIITNELLTQNEKAQLANYDILPESNVQEIAHFSYDKILKIKLALANQETVLAWEIIRTSI